MAEHDNTNRGILSKNDRKESDTHADYRGEVNVDGTDYWLNGWIKQRKDGSGSFLSLSLKRKQPMATAGRPGKKASATIADMPDDVPF